MKARMLALAMLLISPVAMAVQPRMSVHVTYEWSGWGSVSERWVIRRDAYGLTTRVQVVDAPNVQPRLPVLLPIGALSAFEAALQAAPLTRDATVDLITSRLDRPAILKLDPELRSMPAATCSFAQQQAWARQALAGQGLQERVAKHFNGLWTDDYPIMTVVVSRPGRPDTVLVSTSQYTMMLPWEAPVVGGLRSAGSGRCSGRVASGVERCIDGAATCGRTYTRTLQDRLVSEQITRRSCLGGAALWNPAQ